MSTKVLARLLVAVLALVVALGLAACGSDDGDADTGSGEATAATEAEGGGEGDLAGKKIAMIAPFANPFQTDIRRGVEEVAAEHGIDVNYLNFNANSQTEFKYVADVVNSGVDAVIYGANDAKVSIAGFRQINEAGIPIICFDTCVEEDQQEELSEAFVTSDNVQLGQMAGEGAAEWIKENVDGTAKIAFVTCNTQSVCRIRYDAQLSALEGVDYEIVSEQVAIESDKVKSATEGILQANPDLDVVITNGLPQTEGGTAAIENLGHNAVLFGMDMTAVIARDLLKPDGPLQAAVGQDGRAIGRQAMELTVQVLKGETPAEFLHEIPGQLYSRGDTAKVQEFLDTVEE